MSIGLFAAGYLVACDLAAEGRIDRGDDPAAESVRWAPPDLPDADGVEWRAGFESWWEPVS
jgi:hypothetical protein